MTLIKDLQLYGDYILVLSIDNNLDYSLDYTHIRL